MPTNHDETLHERYIRENQAELDSFARMTPERISELAIELNNALAERDELRAELERVKLDARRYQVFRNTPSFGTSFGAASTPEQIDKLCDAVIGAGEGEAK